MQIDTNAEGFDIDGIIASRGWDMAKKRPVFPNCRWLNNLVWLVPVLVHYMLRKPIPQIRERLLQRKQAGKKIVFISANYIFFLPFFNLWLMYRRIRIPHHKTILRLPGASRAVHKARAIYKTGCCCFLDDNKTLIIQIMGELLKLEGENRLKVSIGVRPTDISISRDGIGWLLSRNVQTAK